MKMEKLKIAMVAPLYESVPPKFYGGTERIVSYLTEALVKKGHDVTLYASGDSVTEAKLIAACPRALRLDKDCEDSLAPHILELQFVQNNIDKYDIVHYHNDYLHFPLSRFTNVPSITTLHGRLNIPELKPLYNEFNDMPLISISNSQREPLQQARWIKTVYHGLPQELYKPVLKKQDYLAFLGRISPEKRVDLAVEIAIRCGMHLKVSAKIDKTDNHYYEHVKKILNHPLVEFVGEIGEAEKNKFLGDAKALLFPIDWPEPFGLVMIEAMACGTPVIAYKRGSVPEVLSHGHSGFIVNNVDEAVNAVHNLDTISPNECRKFFEARFTADRMADNYLDSYTELINQSTESSNHKIMHI
jgi:glycosyltransferase involved in cell wall biosynthesis